MKSQHLASKGFVIRGCIAKRRIDLPGKLGDCDNISDSESEGHGGKSIRSMPKMFLMFVDVEKGVMKLGLKDKRKDSS